MSFPCRHGRSFEIVISKWIPEGRAARIGKRLVGGLEHYFYFPRNSWEWNVIFPADEQTYFPEG